MSLRAKIEAVVYAAEEPVTLAQLAAIFGEEVRSLQSAAAAAETVPESTPESIQENAQESARATEEPRTDETRDLPEESAQSEEAASPEPPVAETDAGEASPGETAESAASKRAARKQERAVRDYLRGILDELIAELDASDRGVEIREIAGGYRMATRPEYHDAIRSFVKSLKPPMKLSLQALETLAVVAYKQPVTAPEISEIRGVESAGVLGSLMARKLITTAGRKQVIGRPILYKTTKEFLLRFGLKDLNELPSIEEFEKMAGELAEGDLDLSAALEPDRTAEPQESAGPPVGDTMPEPENAADRPAEFAAAITKEKAGEP